MAIDPNQARKFQDLPNATLPLAGTEIIAISQNGITVQTTSDQFGAGGSSGFFPNGLEIVTVSRDFQSSDAGKRLMLSGTDISVTMPAINPFDIGDYVGVVSDGIDCAFTVENGGDLIYPLKTGDGSTSECVVLMNTDLQGDQWLLPISTSFIYDNGDLKKKTALKHLYDNIGISGPVSEVVYFDNTGVTSDSNFTRSSVSTIIKRADSDILTGLESYTILSGIVGNGTQLNTTSVNLDQYSSIASGMSTDLSTLFSFIGVRKNNGLDIAELEANFDSNNNGLVRLNASSNATNANISLSAGDGINLTWQNTTNSNVFITDGLVSINGDVMHLTVDDTNLSLFLSDGNNNLFGVEPLDMGYITRLNSGVQHKVSDYSGDNNIEGSDYYIKYDLSSAPSILTLPAANISMGYTYIISDAFGYASVNSLTIQCTGTDTINGSSSYILDTDYQAVSIHSDGSNWSINTGAQGPQGIQGIQGIPGPSAVSANANNYSYLGTDSLVYTPKALQLIGQASGSVGITGTTAETQFTGIAIPIPANTFITGDSFMIKSFYTVTGTAGAKTIQFRLGTSAAPSPVTSGISCMSLSVANTAGAFQISRDNNKLLTPSSILAMNPQGLNDVSSTSGVVVYSGIDFTTQLYLYPTVTLVNAADRVTFQKIALFKY